MENKEIELRADDDGEVYLKCLILEGTYMLELKGSLDRIIPPELVSPSQLQWKNGGDALERGYIFFDDSDGNHYVAVSA